MIFADKLITLRKKAGWSQEELAEKLNVTRQSVSKWEGAQSVPDIDKILQLSRLFGVTTDYLLKDDAAEPEYTEDDTSPLPRVTLAQANDYLAKTQANAPKLALATALCIISPIPLLALGTLSEAGLFGIWDDLAGGIGIIALLVIIAAAVAIFMQCSASVRAYEFLQLRLSTASPVWRRSAATPLRRSTTRPTSSARCSVFCRRCRYLPP